MPWKNKLTNFLDGVDFRLSNLFFNPGAHARCRKERCSRTPRLHTTTYQLSHAVIVTSCSQTSISAFEISRPCKATRLLI
jgi:hypothetical protein